MATTEQNAKHVMAYRVVYGETMPAWNHEFATLGEAMAFAKKHLGFGDIIFSITKILPSDASPTIRTVKTKAK